MVLGSRPQKRNPASPQTPSPRALRLSDTSRHAETSVGSTTPQGARASRVSSGFWLSAAGIFGGRGGEGGGTRTRGHF